MSSLLNEGEKKRKREICMRCKRPKLNSCICSALPTEPLTLSKCRVIVLQHPHEQRRKNRSLPLVELCFDKSYSSRSGRNNSCSNNEEGKSQNNTKCQNESQLSIVNNDFHCIIARRLGNQVDPDLMTLINDPNQIFFLVYPSDESIPLKKALEQNDIVEHKKEIANKNIILFFIDATWKYANEMLKAGLKQNSWPSHMIHVKLTNDDFAAGFQPRRFDIRTPPSLDQLSTAECIAQCVRLVEGRDDIFDLLMKPLDLMVKQWHSFSDNDERNPSKRAKTKDCK